MKDINSRYFKNIWKYPCYHNPRHLFQVKRIPEIYVFFNKFWVKLHPLRHCATFKTNAVFWRNWIPNSIHFLLNQWKLVQTDVITKTATHRRVFKTHLTFSENNSNFVGKIKMGCGWISFYAPSIIHCNDTITLLQWCFIQKIYKILKVFIASRFYFEVCPCKSHIIWYSVHNTVKMFTLYPGMIVTLQ